MSQTKNSETFSIPKGINCSIQNGIVTFKGPKGEVSKSFLHPLIKLNLNEDKIELTTEKVRQTEKKLLNTFLSLLKNLVKGVSEGHMYKLKICSGHFPMNVSLKNNVLEIKNFIGEAVPRKCALNSNAEVKLDGNFITVFGIDKELVSQVAASIEKTTRRNGFDKRIFQDGIYIIEKDGKKIE